MTPVKNVNFRKSGSRCTITVAGVLDIFEAEAFLQAARKLVSQTKASQLVLDFTAVERMDLTALQIIHGLLATPTASGASIEIIGLSDSCASMAALVGLAF